MAGQRCLLFAQLLLRKLSLIELLLHRLALLHQCQQLRIQRVHIHPGQASLGNRPRPQGQYRVQLGQLLAVRLVPRLHTCDRLLAAGQLFPRLLQCLFGLHTGLLGPGQAVIITTGNTGMLLRAAQRAGLAIDQLVTMRRQAGNAQLQLLDLLFVLRHCLRLGQCAGSPLALCCGLLQFSRAISQLLLQLCLLRKLLVLFDQPGPL